MNKLLAWIKKWFWEKPTEKPSVKESPRFKEAIELTREYMVVVYDGQKINMLKVEHPFWLKSSRKDKRAMKEKFERMERKGLIRWEKIDDKWICLRNKDYEAKADAQ